MTPRPRRGDRDLDAGADILGARAGRDAPKPGATTARRSRPVRITTDLDPPLHAKFKAWTVNAAAELDVPGVAGADVVRALIQRLVKDRALAADVLEAIREQHT